MKLSEIHRDFILFVGLGVALGAVWNHIYVQPHDEFRSIVGSCMVERSDMSPSGYESCVNEMMPSK
tara:strand:- start:646 stop:843 length:198 start_codon:yes stop_codon:yes gene_type:complete